MKVHNLIMLLAFLGFKSCLLLFWRSLIIRVSDFSAVVIMEFYPLWNDLNRPIDVQYHCTNLLFQKNWRLLTDRPSILPNDSRICAIRMNRVKMILMVVNWIVQSGLQTCNILLPLPPGNFWSEHADFRQYFDRHVQKCAKKRSRRNTPSPLFYASRIRLSSWFINLNNIQMKL